MLPPALRLTRRTDFTDVVRRGRRASRPLLTVHLSPGRPEVADAPDVPPLSVPPRAGLVVGKAVGGSVVRSRVSRRLRHLLRERLEALPPGSRLVVRAAPAAADAASPDLAADLDAALARLARR